MINSIRNLNPLIEGFESLKKFIIMRMNLSVKYVTICNNIRKFKKRWYGRTVVYTFAFGDINRKLYIINNIENVRYTQIL